MDCQWCYRQHLNFVNNYAALGFWRWISGNYQHSLASFPSILSAGIKEKQPLCCSVNPLHWGHVSLRHTRPSADVTARGNAKLFTLINRLSGTYNGRSSTYTRMTAQYKGMLSNAWNPFSPPRFERWIVRYFVRASRLNTQQQFLRGLS